MSSLGHPRGRAQRARGDLVLLDVVLAHRAGLHRARLRVVALRLEDGGQPHQELERRFDTSGRTSRTNGRICVRTTGVSFLATGVTTLFVEASCWNAGCSAVDAGPSWSANALTFPSATVLARSAPGSFWIVADTLWS